MKQNKPPSTRKQPSLSAEEELAELLSDPTLKPSINFLGLRDASPALALRRNNESVPDTVSVSDTGTVPGTDTTRDAKRIIFNRAVAPGTEAVPDTDTVAGTDTVKKGLSVSGTGTVSDTDTRPVLIRKAPRKPAVSEPHERYKAPKPRQAQTAEDGHSHSEQHLYDALWAAAEPRDRDSRMITIGFGSMARLARLSLNNCRLNIRSLIRKLAIEELQDARCDAQVGKTYLLFGSPAILKRRKTAGLEWVVRTKGVVFVDPSSGAMLTDPVTPSGNHSNPSNQEPTRY